MKQPHEDSVRLRRMKVLEKYCVDIQVGDIWLTGNQRIRVAKFTRKVEYANGTSASTQDFEGSGYLPWPIVTYVDEDGGEDFIGAPAFKFMSLERNGDGERWEPKKEIDRIRVEEQKKKEKEDERTRARASTEGAQRR